MNIKHSWLVTSLSCLSAGAICGCVGLLLEKTSEDRVVYLEEFDHYADTVNAFTEGTKVFSPTPGKPAGDAARTGEYGIIPP